MYSDQVVNNLAKGATVVLRQTDFQALTLFKNQFGVMSCGLWDCVV